MYSTSLRSCLYRGIVRHRRYAPVWREFRYSLYFLYLDLAEFPQLTRRGLFGWLQRFRILRFDRGDHTGDPAEPLESTIRNLAEQQLGRRPPGPIRLLTQLRHFGYIINPISLYYCFNQEDTRLDCVVAEVTNTPWGERCCYVVDCLKQQPGGLYRQRSRKQLHVSPFLPMELEYRWRLTAPGRRLLVHLDDLPASPPAAPGTFDLESRRHIAGQARPANRLLDATLLLQRQTLTGMNLMFCLARFPLMTIRIAVAIYLQALRLWWRKVPFHAHPGHEKTPGPSVARRQAG